jgi:hypothetical protein
MYELVFWGGSPISYVRNHASYETAQAEARRVLEELDIERNAHPAIIYGPDCGAHGTTIP